MQMTDKAKHYHDRAAELHDLAEQSADPRDHDMLTGMSAAYERLARDCERRVSGKRQPKPADAVGQEPDPHADDMASRFAVGCAVRRREGGAAMTILALKEVAGRINVLCQYRDADEAIKAAWIWKASLVPVTSS